MSQNDMSECVKQLSDFRRRSAAMKQLVAAGEKSVVPLMIGLEEENDEGAIWAILQCLADLKVEKAVGPIASLLADSRYKSAAHDALMSIVGEDLGTDPSPWRDWFEEGSDGVYAPKMHQIGLSDEKLMRLSMKPLNADWSRVDDGRYKVGMPINNGKERKNITVDLDKTDHEGAPIAIMYCDCGPASESNYGAALRHNLKMPYGALALRDSASGPRFVMFNTLLKEDMSPLELCKSARTVAERAVSVRQDLERISE